MNMKYTKEAEQRHYDYYAKLAANGNLPETDRLQWEYAKRKRTERIEAEGVTEEDIAETRFPVTYPDQR